MLVTREVEKMAKHGDYEHLLKVIHEPLQQLEERMLEGYTEEITIVKIRPEYTKTLATTVELLSSISANLFLNVDPHHVTTYPSDKLIPPDYHHYRCALENLTSFIQASIFSTNQVSLSLLAMERWIYILKQSYESGDFFTAGAIVTALSRLEVARTDLHLYISNTAKGILEYFQPIFSSMDRVHALQIERNRHGSIVLPQLMPLIFLNSKEAAQVHSEAYLAMKKSIKPETLLTGEGLREFLITSWDDKQKTVIAQNSESISFALKDKEAKPRVDMNVLSMVFKFYDESDYYYACKRALQISINKLNDVASDFSGKNLNKFNCISAMIEVLKNPSYRLVSKFEYMVRMMSETSGHFDGKLNKLFENIKNELQSLFRYEEKFRNLECDIRYVELKLNHKELWSRLNQPSLVNEKLSSENYQFIFFSKNLMGQRNVVSLDRASSFTMGFNANNDSH